MRAFVDANTAKYEGKAEKINVNIARRVLHRIDTYAASHGQKRSGFLKRAAMEIMRKSEA